MLFAAFPASSRADDLLAVKTYLTVLEPFSTEAVRRSVQQFITGKVPTHDGRFVPSAAELARNVDQWHTVLCQIEENRKALPLASGIMQVDFGHGPIDMSKLSLAEQDEVLRTGRAPQITIGPVAARLQALTDHRLRPDMSEAAVQQRLMGYSVGVPESDENAA